MFTRREVFRVAAGAGAVLVAAPTAFAARAADEKKAAGFTLPKLPYAYDALEPNIDAETMTIHHDKHHQAYVDNLNKALTAAAPEWLSKPIEEVVTHLKDLPEKARTAVRNNGGGHWNHTFFWNVMAKPGTGGEPKGDLLKAIDSSFGTLDGFKKEFAAAAATRFGSGWAWLVPGKEKPLAVVSTPNQDNPLMDGGPAPILGIDVWEHAYYLKYRNLRPKYVEAWLGVVNWDAVAANFNAAKKS
ncbi:superoxide dismutase [Fimbriiglobus ruber]|uniref:Superoxide dismutase n=1 Tax=Fimbriiglobus ruber TaxID=1908690 RepID=A0A225ECJ8_9BACT|nr:superoxide dismutase [Fimbriiglobus ruber]OWK47059.1 Manganese superoxide dismutase [Fimbriiglobus ruber]